MKSINTGILSFDWYLKGGLPPNIFLLSGIPGSGSEIFTRQIAYTQALTNKISYFTVNATSDSVKEDMLAYGWNINQLEKMGNWKFLHILKDNNFVKTVIDEMKQHRTVIIDSLSELLLKHKTEEIVNLITSMSLHNNDRTKFHLLLLTEGMQDKKTETTMEHFAEGVIAFNTSWMADSTIRYIIIKKIQGTTVPTRRLEYSLGKKGFVIETARRI